MWSKRQIIKWSGSLILNYTINMHYCPGPEPPPVSRSEISDTAFEGLKNPKISKTTKKPQCFSVLTLPFLISGQLHYVLRIKISPLSTWTHRSVTLQQQDGSLSLFPMSICPAMVGAASSFQYSREKEKLCPDLGWGSMREVRQYVAIHADQKTG